MYPKVFADFAVGVAQVRPGRGAADAGLLLRHGGRRRDHRRARAAARRWSLRLQAIGETDEEGQVRVFFELNGQPRIVRVPNRAAVAKLPARRKAEDGNDAHVAAPMPGSVSTISVRAGQPVKAGDVLLTIEAMKMETALHAPRDGVVKEVLVHAASPIDAKDLLVVLEELASVTSRSQFTVASRFLNSTGDQPPSTHAIDKASHDLPVTPTVRVNPHLEP